MGAVLKNKGCLKLNKCGVECALFRKHYLRQSKSSHLLLRV